MAIRFVASTNPAFAGKPETALIAEPKKRRAKFEKAKVAIAKATDLANRKPGRPVAPKPWIEAGVSRMTWYRRQKEAAKRKSSLSSPS